jgi:RIO-like serine/threonine protein kinase
MVNWQKFSKSELRDFAIKTYRQGGGSRPDVFLLEHQGEQAVLKDHDGMDKWFAKLIGPLLAWREAKALKKLTPVSGIPNLLCQPDKRSLLMENIIAEQIVNSGNSKYNATEYFKSLKELITAMHKQGVAHGDLRSPTNALIDTNGKAALVDFVASLHQGPSWNIFSRYFFNKMALVDFSAITKLKKRIAPDLLDDTDFEAIDVAGKKGLAFRKAGQWVRAISRKLFSN